jgi:O-antigen ligase
MRLETKIHFGLLLLALYLLRLSDSKTSLICLLFGAAIILATRLAFFRKQPHLLGVGALALVLTFWVFDETVGVKENVVAGLGRDMTFTGRTEVWRELLRLHTDPLLGVGFMSLWDDKRLQAQLPEWVAGSAHNGYLEEYLGGGWVGIFFLIVMLLATGLRINKALGQDGDYGAVRLAVFSVFLIGNYSESHIACMSTIGFLFLLAAIGHAQTVFQASPASESLPEMDELEPSEARGQYTVPL